MPFPSDIEYLKSKNVCGVVNLCYEYSGPIKEYSKHQISHLHLPTLDIQDPSLEHMKLAVQFIDNLLTPSNSLNNLQESSSSSEKVVFIHCKGGRGRAVITCICYLIFRGYSLQDSFAKIKSCRSVASEAVVHSPVVKKFEKFIKSDTTLS